MKQQPNYVLKNSATPIKKHTYICDNNLVSDRGINWHDT